MQTQSSLTAVPGPTAAPTARSKARFWDRVARKYVADPIADLAGYETTRRRVKALLNPEHQVLEIGYGTGTTARRLAGGTRRVLATDVSAEMITIALEKNSLRRHACNSASSVPTPNCCPPWTSPTTSSCPSTC